MQSMMVKRHKFIQRNVNHVFVIFHWSRPFHWEMGLQIRAIISVWWMARPQPQASGMYIRRWLWQDDKTHDGRCVWLRCSCQVGWHACLYSFKWTPYLPLHVPTHETKAFPMFVWFTSRVKCTPQHTCEHTHTRICTHAHTLAKKNIS